MQKKYIWILVAVIVIVGVIVGYEVLKKPATKTASNYTSSTNTSNSSNTSSSSSNNSATQVNNAVLITKNDATVGVFLADPSGNALYTYGSDTKGVSNCTGSCLSSWPAYQDKGSTTGLPANVSTIKRTDNGQIQYTYKGMPLYYFIGDKSNQVTGNGVSGFYVAVP